MYLTAQRVDLYGWTVLGLSGELDLATAPQARSELQAPLAPDTSLAVDLRGVTFCDPIGVGLLLGARRRTLDLGGHFALVVPAGRVRDTLDALEVTSIFVVVDDPAALAALG